MFNMCEPEAAAQIKRIRLLPHRECQRIDVSLTWETIVVTVLSGVRFCKSHGARRSFAGCFVGAQDLPFLR